MRSIFFRGVSAAIMTMIAASAFGHGVVEKPASREQFCGVETKPHEIYGKLAHEECRPMLTKSDGSLDNSIYNFMAVLTHTTGRQGRTQANLPKNVCGFDAETWGGGKTPWDRAMDWPVSTISAGKNTFVWNIVWGNHFGDTEEFAYWITKPEFVFSKDRELTWNDFEDKPFCLLKYNDTNPSSSPDIVADKAASKFFTSCNVPARKNRAVIYGEWGRNYWTFERFHSCMDVVFSGSTPAPSVNAVISALPDTVTGARDVVLDASQSQGDNLSYHWSFTAGTPSLYTLYDADKVKARLAVGNPAAEQRVTVNLSVQQGAFSSNTSKTFVHYPAVKDVWRLIGMPSENATLAAGDKISLRIIDADGRDVWLPAVAIVLDSESGKATNWIYTLAQAINGKNNYTVRIGVLNATTSAVDPIRSATANGIYALSQSGINNAYVMVEKKQDSGSVCRVQRKSGSSAWWMGYDIYASKAPITLDFTATGIDLTKVTVSAGVFSGVKVLDSHRLLINQKPTWVSSTSPGYIGFNASNYAPLTTSIVAACKAG